MILDDVSFTVDRGESVAVVGPSGSGKSTLAAIVATLLRPQSGTVRIDGTDVLTLRSSRLAAFRRATIGVIFQQAELVPTMTAVENVALPAMLDGLDRAAAERRARELLDEVQLGETDTPAGDLSGGEAQRVGIARALVGSPALVVADEPTASLDGRTKSVVADLLYSRLEAHGAGLLIVSHDPEVASRADRVLRLEDRRLTAQLAEVH
ncbi:ABC transporter ATP-binding protein [Cellulomonas sp. PSBB021]|uniref:ABC transporter ATP-binding protein n=1 Tax=Cellulomonas sp. PSBB021 TaxID=2003551 RepID=UPI0018DFB8DE|nr:ABC transporter ATP-binding protein [Cellulomonas sp. PSBB021]